MTDIERLEQKIKILEEKINAHNQKIEGYADTFTVAINSIKENQGKFLSIMSLIFSVLGILLVGVQIGLIFFKP